MNSQSSKVLCAQTRDDHVDRSKYHLEKRKRAGEETSECSEPKRYCLTEKNLHRHQKQEKALSSTRNVSSHSDQTRGVSTTTSNTKTGQQFGPRLKKNGIIYGGPKTLAPEDDNEVKTALAEAREIPASRYDGWQGLWTAWKEMALSESSLKNDIIALMLSLYRPPDGKYRKSRGHQWTEFDNEITTGLSDPKPDMVESYLLSKYPEGTREEFGELVPTQYGYVMPTFAMESTGQSDPSQVEEQAAFDGAVMTHAALAAETRMGRSDDGLYSKTKAITITLTPMEICVYADHTSKDESQDKVFYHHSCMERIRCFDPEENWKKACTVLINAQAFAFNLAESRVRALEEYFKQKDVRIDNVKAEQARLQAEARAKVTAALSGTIP